MKKSSNMTHAQKITNRIDQLLMEDVCFTSQGFQTQQNQQKTQKAKRSSNNSTLNTSFKGNSLLSSNSNLKTNKKVPNNKRINFQSLSQDRKNIPPPNDSNNQDNKSQNYKINFNYPLKISPLLSTIRPKQQVLETRVVTSNFITTPQESINQLVNSSKKQKLINLEKQNKNDAVNFMEFLIPKKTEEINKNQQMKLKKTNSQVIEQQQEKNQEDQIQKETKNKNKRKNNKFSDTSSQQNSCSYQQKIQKNSNEQFDFDQQNRNQNSPSLLINNKNNQEANNNQSKTNRKRRQRNNQNIYKQKFKDPIKQQISDSQQRSYNLNIDNYINSRGFTTTNWRKNILKGNYDNKNIIKQPFQQSQNISVQNNKNKNSFNISHEELQFLTLLYPDQSPQQLMIKLLNYYVEEQRYKNSLYEVIQEEKHRQFKEITQNQDQQQYQKPKSSGIFKNQLKFKESIQLSSQQEQFAYSHQSFSKLTSEQYRQKSQKKLKQYHKLKQQCLSALGSQMVQTQIKKSQVQTANVNYYTRQYAMPQILQMLEQKNEQAKQRLQQNIENCLKASQNSNSSLFLNSSGRFTFKNYQQSYTHKIYIPANSRGQCFDMDYKPDSKLFQYLPQNDYRRIMRDINHLIQKVLSYHRHNSFLKKKNNYLLQGWNLALLICIILTVIFLYGQSILVQQRQQLGYLQILIFFFVALVLILILGNAFNNYKRDVKRSSLIKDICEQITNYFQFINCSSKKVKWILGKDFFWIQLWITIRNRR